MRYVLFFAFFAYIVAETGQLNNFVQALNTIRARQQISDMILDNPHLKSFEKEYYINPAAKQSPKLTQLADLLEDLKKDVRYDFPFAGYSSLDTNLYNRFVKEDIENEQYRKVGALLDEIKFRKQQKDFPNVPIVDPAVVADVKYSIKEIDRAKRNNDLRLPHSPLFTRPYEDGKESMTKLNNRINTLNANLKRPLQAPQPSQEEIAALNRLNEKMDAINKRISSLPSPSMEEHVLVQAQMVGGLADLLKRMTDAIDEERREGFLYQIHALLHKHRLHDHPQIQEFEHDLARSIATGDRFETKDIRLPAPYASASTFTGNERYDYTQYEAARNAALKTRNLNEANHAHNVASEMKGYGQELVSKSKEMQRRAEMMERQQAVPAGNQDNLAYHLKMRTY